MASCGMVSSSTATYGLHEASLICIPSSTTLDHSPTSFSNGTMGSTSSLLADSGYRGGSSHYSDTTTNSNSSVFEEPASQYDDVESIGPPKLTPVSGKLEKTKEKRLIRPIAVRFASPNTSPTETPKRSASQSPSLSDTMATYAQPPDVVLTNQGQGFSMGNHFGKPPTKAMSLQDITPIQHSYRVNGHHNVETHAESHGSVHQKIQPAQSLNFLNRGWQNSHSLFPGKIGNSRHRSQSQSVFSENHPLQAVHGFDFRQSSQPNLLSPQGSSENHRYSPHSGSSVTEASDLAEENRILRNKVQDMKCQLVAMRGTMERNEQTIFQVQEEKRRDYEGRISRLQGQLQQAKESSHFQQRAQQQEIYKLEQDRKHLRVRLEELQKDMKKLKDQSSKVEEQKSVLAESQQEITNKRFRIKRLEEDAKHLKDELQKEKENVKRLQIELDKTRLQVTKRNGERHQQILSKKDAEIAQAKNEAEKAAEHRDSLMLRVKAQSEEIDRLGALMKKKELELGQEKCEVAYLKDIQERLTQQVKEKEEKVEKTISNEEMTCVNNNNKQDSTKLELARTVEKVEQLQTEKDMESARLQKKLAEKENEIRRLQARLRDRAKSSEPQKVSSVKPKLERDVKDLQARLAKREQELKQAQHQISMLQSQERNSGAVLSNSILQKKEAELKASQERLHQRTAEVTYIRDKLSERDAELTALKVKLDRVHRQNPENGRRAGSLDRELSGARAAKQQLESQVSSLREENGRLKEKLSRVASGVLTLSASHTNLAKMSMVPSIPEKPKFERTDAKVVGRLQQEMGELKQEIARMKGEKEKQLSEFRREQGIWQEEKHRVIAYQKQLQLNYVQMCQRNKKLEHEVQQLTKELGSEEVIQC